MPRQNSLAAMERKAGELRDLGITLFTPIVEPGEWRYAIALARFRSEAGARHYLEVLRAQGVRTAEVGQRDQRATHRVLTVREPTPDEAARLAALAADFPEAELRALDCPA